MVRKILIIGIVLLMILGMVGCSSKEANVTKKSVEEETLHNEKKSELPQLTLDEAFQKIDKKESFIFMVTQSTCTYCENFKKTLVPFLKEHPDIPFYEIEVDMLGEKKADINKNFEKLQKKVPEFEGGTPEMFCYQDGNLKKAISGELSLIALRNFMIDCGYIQGEKQKEETVDYRFPTSKHIQFQDILKVSKKIEKKETFYLMLTEIDRYNQAFIKKLIPILEEKNITVIGLSFPLEQTGSADEMNKAYEVVMNSLEDMKLSPSVFKVKDGKAEKLMEDNLSVKEIEEAFSKK